MRTFLCCRLGWRSFFFSLQPVNATDEEKYGKRHDNKADDGVYESP